MDACNGPDLRKSIAACTDILRKPQPKEVKFAALRNRAIRELALNDPVNAERDAQQAISIDGSDTTVRLVKINATLKLGGAASASRELDEVLRREPENSDALTLRSLIDNKFNRFDEAIGAATKAIAIDTNNAAAYNNRGIAYRFNKDYGRAIADFDAAARLSPQNDRPFYNRGEAYRLMGNREAAMRDYDAAVALNPQDREARSARDYMRQTLDREKADAEHQEALSRMQRRQDDLIFLDSMERSGGRLNADQQATFERIQRERPDLQQEVQRLKRSLERADQQAQDEQFVGALRDDCGKRQFSTAERDRLEALDKNPYDRNNLLAHTTLQCQDGYVSNISAAAEMKRGLATAPTECRSGFEKMEYFSKNKETANPLIEASGLADAGDSEGACRLIVKVVHQAEATRADLVACYHALPASASDEQTRLKQAVLFGAGQMHQMQESLAPAVQKLRCSE